MYHALTLFLYVCQIMLLTRNWTKINIAAVCVSVVLFFIGTGITHSTVLFKKAPADYIFIGTRLNSLHAFF